MWSEANPRAIFQGGAWHQFSYPHLGSNTAFICHQIYRALTVSICITISQSLSYCYTAKRKAQDRFLRCIRLNNVVLPIPQALNQLMLCVWRYIILVNKSFQSLWMVMQSGTLTSNVKWVIIIQRQSVQYGEELQATSAVMAHSNLQHVIKEGNSFHNSHLCHVTACDLSCFLYQLSAGVNHLNLA